MSSISIFSGLQKYADRFQIKDSRDFSAEELAAVKEARVVASEFGLSVCFFMHEGCQMYIPVARDSVCSVGDTVDLSAAKILTLSRDGSADINRILIP